RLPYILGQAPAPAPRARLPQHRSVACSSVGPLVGGGRRPVLRSALVHGCRREVESDRFSGADYRPTTQGALDLRVSSVVRVLHLRGVAVGAWSPPLVRHRRVGLPIAPGRAAPGLAVPPPQR